MAMRRAVRLFQVQAQNYTASHRQQLLAVGERVGHSAQSLTANFAPRLSKTFLSAGFTTTAHDGASTSVSALELALRRSLQRARGVISQHRHRLDDVARRWAELEGRAAAVVNGLALSGEGQKLLAACLPVMAGAALFPGRFKCLAFEAISPMQPYRKALQVHKQGLQFKLPDIKMPQWAGKVAEELLTWARAVYLVMLFTPAVALAPFALSYGMWREQWMDLIRWTLMKAGPAFIKWGQWASTRPDLFPPDLCHSLEQLQSNAPSHSSAHSRRAVQAAFQRPLHTLFDYFEDEPVASGSIAQIHRARLSAAGASFAGLKAGTTVAVKVRHPNVTTVMHRDFVLMERAARLASMLPGLSELRLDESIRQFGGPLKEQLDLEVEANHLARFKRNFRLKPNVSFPTPLYPFVSQDVLVESFEDGDLISRFVNEPSYKYRMTLAETGMTCYLQMLLQDNFIHADLHPGNILVREVDAASCKGLSGLVARLVPPPPHLIFLDTGMIAELAKDDRQSLMNFFRALTTQDGTSVAHAILNMSERHTCKNESAFVDSMRHMFDSMDPEYISKHTSRVIEAVIENLRQHSVTLKSTVSTVVVTTLVLEGWSSKLNPDMRILDHVRDMLVVDWTERISRTVDKIMRSGALAVV